MKRPRIIIQLKRDTLENWNKNHKYLLDQELILIIDGLEKGEARFLINDKNKAFKELKFLTHEETIAALKNLCLSHNRIIKINENAKNVTLIILLKDTEQNFKNCNIVLANGEIAFCENDRFKIGNGILCWNELPFAKIK